MVTLHDIIYDHPSWFVIAGISWIFIGIWVISLIGWMIQGEVDVLFGILGIALAFVLGYFSFMPPIEILRPFTAISVVGLVIVYPFLRKALTDREMLSIDVEAMENAYELLHLKPDNHMIRFKLGKLLFERGNIESGLAVGADALRNMPEGVFTDEHRMYGRWRRLHPNANVNKMVTCMDCGHSNPATAVNCEKCGEPHLLNAIRGRWVGRQFGRKLLAGWIAGILALAGIPLASQLPPTAAIGAMIAIMIGALFLLWMAFRATGETVRS